MAKRGAKFPAANGNADDADVPNADKTDFKIRVIRVCLHPRHPRSHPFYCPTSTR